MRMSEVSFKVCHVVKFSTYWLINKFIYICCVIHLFIFGWLVSILHILGLQFDYRLICRLFLRLIVQSKKMSKKL